MGNLITLSGIHCIYMGYIPQNPENNHSPPHRQTHPLTINDGTLLWALVYFSGHKFYLTKFWLLLQ